MLFTSEELQLIIQLADLALRTQGLQAANAVMPLAAKCQALLVPPVVSAPIETEAVGEAN